MTADPATGSWPPDVSVLRRIPTDAISNDSVAKSALKNGLKPGEIMTAVYPAVDPAGAIVWLTLTSTDLLAAFGQREGSGLRGDLSPPRRIPLSDVPIPTTSWAGRAQTLSWVRPERPDGAILAVTPEFVTALSKSRPLPDPPQSATPPPSTSSPTADTSAPSPEQTPAPASEDVNALAMQLLALADTETERHAERAATCQQLAVALITEELPAGVSALALTGAASRLLVVFSAEQRPIDARTVHCAIDIAGQYPAFRVGSD